MQTIDFYFDIQRCESSNLYDYSAGEIPFVSSTKLNNGVVKYVSLLDENELIKNVPCIVVNTFGFATVQTKPFIGGGNGGGYINPLIPKQTMSMIELAYYAGQINLQSWRFSYGRRAIKRRLIELKLKKFDKNIFNENILLDLKNNMMLQINNFIDDFSHLALLSK